MDQIIAGFADAFTLVNIALVFGGVLLGQIFGAIPGLSALTAIAIAVPLTYYLSPVGALGFLVGINKGGTVGGAVSAILMNTPGSPEAAATAFDGHPLAKQGKPLKALKIALYSSVSGDTISDLVLILVAAPLAAFAIRMGPPEIMSVVILALTVIAGLVGRSLLKGLISAALGMLLSTVGLDPEAASERFVFGIPELMDGIPIAAAGIGVLAMGEVLHQIKLHARGTNDTHLPLASKTREDRRISFAEFRSCIRTILRSAAIGTGIGAIPGIGSSAAAFIGYEAAKRASDEPESFGKGNIQGVAAVEAANSAVVGSNFIPLLALGIPGNLAAALILGAFVVHGITPGPHLMAEQGRLIYGLFGAMIVGNICNFFIGNAGLRFFALITHVPANIVFPATGLLCLTGAFLAGGSFAMLLVTGFALLGYILRKLDFSFVTFIIGFVLGPMFELTFRQTVILADGEISYMLDRPIALCVLAVASGVLVRVLLKRKASA